MGKGLIDPSEKMTGPLPRQASRLGGNLNLGRQTKGEAEAITAQAPQQVLSSRASRSLRGGGIPVDTCMQQLCRDPWTPDHPPEAHGIWDVGCMMWDVGCGMWDVERGTWDVGRDGVDERCQLVSL